MADYQHLTEAIAAADEGMLDRLGRWLFALAQKRDPGPMADLLAATGFVLIDAGEERGRLLEALDPEPAVGGFIEGAGPGPFDFSNGVGDDDEPGGGE